MREYVKLSEWEIRRMLDEVDRFLGGRHLSHIATPKSPSQAKEFLIDTPYIDFVTMNDVWLDENVNSQRNGVALSVPSPVEDTEEAYRIRCRSVDYAIERIQYIVSTSNESFTYFKVITPDQPFPRFSYVKEDTKNLIHVKTELESSRDGYVRKGILDV